MDKKSLITKYSLESNQQDNKPKLSFCPNCGTPMNNSKFCSKCGAELADEVQFCSSCGIKVNAEPEQESQSQQISSAPKKLGQLEKQQTTGRLAVLLVPPVVSIVFSLLAMILHAFPGENNVIEIIKSMFIIFIFHWKMV